MPRDISGNYTLPAGNPVVTATIISSTWANTTLSDIATAMTNSLDRTGTASGMTGQFKAIDGTIGAPGLSWGNDVTSGWYRAGAGDYRFSISARDTIRIIAAGNVTVAAPTGGIGFLVSGAANSEAIKAKANSTAGQSYGLHVAGGTTSADYAFRVDNQSEATTYFQVRGDGALTGYGPTAAGLVDMTPDSGSFTLTATVGFTTNPTFACTWKRIGGLVMIHVGNNSATSNVNTWTMSGLPAILQPSGPQTIAITNCIDNGVALTGVSSVGIPASSSTFNMYKDGAAGATNWTASGTKGTNGFVISYFL